MTDRAASRAPKLRRAPSRSNVRVVYAITRSDTIGGGHVHIRDLALTLQAHGDEAIVLVGQEGPFTEELSRRGIPYHSLRHLIHPIRPWRDGVAFFEIRALLRRLQPDLVSTHSAKAGWLCPMAAASLGIPSIQTTHGWSFTTGVPPAAALCYRWAERVGVMSAHRVINVSEYDRQLALRYHVAPPEKLLTVHNGMPDIPPHLRAQPERAPVRLAMVARFEAQKDHATLFHALARLGEYAWELDLIGDGPLRSQAAALAQDLKIFERVCFLGACNDVAERLARQQVFLLITNWEGFPRSILEAMRAGLPVVASDVGGVSESVLDGTTGFLVPRGDVELLRARLALLLRDPSLRRRLGRAGRTRYEDRFTLAHMVEKTLAVYREVIGQRVEADERLVPGRLQPAFEPPPMRLRKRLCDLVWALAGLLLLSPLFLLIALLIRLDDGGPIFYRQERVGYRGRLFRIWKFRTMVTNAETLGTLLTVAEDPRLTRAGRWLRRSKLDELPQLFNVMSGDMSFVGPRPEVPRYVAHLSPEQRAVLALVPGITDPAAVANWDESALLDPADPERVYLEDLLPAKIRLSLHYSQSATVRSDVWVIAQTIGKFRPQRLFRR